MTAASRPKIVGIVQARMGSKRLPGKVLANIEGMPMLIWVVERARSAESLDWLLVATSTEVQDDAVDMACVDRGIQVFRGDPTDVLDRYYHAALSVQADVIVRLTGDCPLIDPGLIDDVVQAFLAADPPVDFASNRLPDQRTYPIGTDVEVFGLEALRKAWKNADQPYHREHVMPYLYEEPGRFRTLLLRNDRDLGQLRWAVDEQRDLEFVRRVYASLGSGFSWMEVLELLEREPAILELNATVQQRGLHS